MNVPDLFNRSQAVREFPIRWSQIDHRGRAVVRRLAASLDRGWSPAAATIDARVEASDRGLGWSAAWLSEMARSFVEIRGKSTALVGPLVRVVYGGHDRLVTTYVDLPRDTRDPRWESCIDHHPACDCREAEHAEMVAEYRSEAREASRVHHAAASVLRVHTPDRSDWTGNRRCGECHNPWPCSTYTLLREAMGWTARNLELTHPLNVEVPF